MEKRSDGGVDGLVHQIGTVVDRAQLHGLRENRRRSRDFFFDSIDHDLGIFTDAGERHPQDYLFAITRDRTEAQCRGFFNSRNILMLAGTRTQLRGWLEIVETFAHVLADIGRADFWWTGVQSFAALLPRTGAMTDAEARSWLAELAEAAASGRFFGSSNYYSYVLRRV